MVCFAAVSVVAALVVAGCGGSSSNTSTGSTGPKGSGSDGTYSITAGVLHAFTGQNAFFGSNAQNACKAAASQINAVGGALGTHKLTCTAFDTKGDPADAVPVTNRMLVSASHLAMVVGPDGNDIPSVLPLVQQAKIPEMNTVGDPRYDKQTSPYFWRLTPSDSTQAPALAYYPASSGLLKSVSVFTSDLSAQTTVAPFEAKYTQLGGTLLAKLTISPSQSSYQTEVSRALQTNPQALVGEMDARTASTFLGQLQQQNGKLIPFVVTQRATQPDWAPAVSSAIGASNLQKYVTAVAPDQPNSGTAVETFQKAIKSVGGNQFQQQNPFVAATYDGVIVFALAMELSKSTDPTIYVKRIASVTSPKAGATVVTTYADAVNAIKAGKTIQYVGATGKMIFNRYNTAQHLYAAWNYDPSQKGWKVTKVLPLQAIVPAHP